ncbi:MAG: hypothetical protein ACKVQS_13355 [Fimbriimonadaceae bacterium]
MEMPPPVSAPVPAQGDPFSGNHFVLKRQLLKLIGASFNIYDVHGVQILQANQKGFKLKEDIRLMGGPGLQTELIGIFARKVMDFSASYDVMDLQTNQRIGVFRRKGWHSLARDEWIVMDANEVAIGTLIEDTLAMALLRRLLTNLIPQNYDLLVGEVRKVDLKQNFNPFSYHLGIEFFTPPQDFDRRMGLAGAVLLAAIEGRQAG